jgi:hypothetical protein
VENCTENIFQKTYANIVIYIAYFTTDNFVLKSLLRTLDGLFSKADDWILSDKSKSIMIGLTVDDPLTIESESDVEDNRVRLLRDKIGNIIDNAESVVAKYTLPFLDSNIQDSEYMEDIDDKDIDADSYMKSVNALLRIHSVIGQILSGRSGTYESELVLSCILKMVQASGRYATLNHAIAALLVYDKDSALSDIVNVYETDKLSSDEKYKKVMRIFAFWSVYLSQAGLARYLSQDHSIRALEKLVEDYERDEIDGFIPFNFSSVLIIAKLYNTGVLDKPAIENILRKYGNNSSLRYLIRVAVHIYSYYMPLSIQDKQWIVDNLKIPMKRIEIQKLKAVTGEKN